MFESGMKGCVTGECRITGISGEVLQLMVDYMLGKGIGFVEDVDMIRQLLVAADVYSVDLANFKARCDSRLVFTLREKREKLSGAVGGPVGHGVLKKTFVATCRLPVRLRELPRQCPPVDPGTPKSLCQASSTLILEEPQASLTIDRFIHQGRSEDLVDL
ncbi:hypothetical protein RvY_11986 [Ramazzottius varieornatus]|uniref:BTB domain-containing protein n=1 Tax=Ramazzottius varieornatus TaxID=947166 RepID=A0A1D1VKC7_RAMVA|nr:hypothetical protein RvY_11986 [Ramazzottius varieornatus]